MEKERERAKARAIVRVCVLVYVVRLYVFVCVCVFVGISAQPTSESLRLASSCSIFLQTRSFPLLFFSPLAVSILMGTRQYALAHCDRVVRYSKSMRAYIYLFNFGMCGGGNAGGLQGCTACAASLSCCILHRSCVIQCAEAWCASHSLSCMRARASGWCSWAARSSASSSSSESEWISACRS